MEVSSTLPQGAKLTYSSLGGTRTVIHATDIAADAANLALTLVTPIEALAPTPSAPFLPTDRAFRFVPMPGSVTTVSLSWDDYDPDLGTGAYHSTLVHTDNNKIEFDEIVSAGADVSAGQTVSYSLSGSNEASDIAAFLDENRTSTGVRTVSYEVAFDLPLP